MIPPHRLRSVDLDLLPVLRELLRLRSVTRAARALNMSQSAASEALGRLRHLFDDPILVRSGRAMVVTGFAEGLRPHVEAALAAVEAMLAPEQFDPGRLDRQFVVATADTVVLALGGAFVDRLAAEAPAASVQFIDLQFVEAAQLEKGELDLVIVPEGFLAMDGLDHFLVYEEDFVCIARRGHPALAGGMDRSVLDRLPRLAYRADRDSPLFGSLTRGAMPDLIRTPQFNVLPFLVAGSDAVAAIQRHVARRFAAVLDLEIHELPEPWPTIRVTAYWGAVHARDPAHIWFRRLVEQVARERGGPEF